MVQPRVGLDNAALRNRVRGYVSRPLPKVVARQGPKPAQLNYIHDFGEPAPVKVYKQPVYEPQILEQALTFPIPKSRVRRLKDKSRAVTSKINLGYALSAGAAVFIIAGSLLGINGFKSNQQVEAQVKALSATNSSQSATNGSEGATTTQGGTDETPVTVNNVWSYAVGPNLPKVIRIPSLQVEARIKRVGVNNDNSMGTPVSIFDAGWYEGSSKPGEDGAMFIDGHVSGPTQHGIFYDLKKLKAGDTVSIVRGDNKIYDYKVVASEIFPANSVDMGKALKPYTAGKQGLNLMTCTGRFVPSTQHFDDRIVVYTILQ